MAGRGAEVSAVLALATIVTVAIAAPVLRAPSERVFGMEIVGRHHDPFTAMAQFERPVTIGVYSQPLTDLIGALLARLSGGVAAYNWLVLLSFPLAAAAAYLLARHLGLLRSGAAVAAMAYAFSPFHVAHAAYHPHIAQTHWIPLYLLALWRCLDHASLPAVGFLGVAALAVTLSNFYGGLIAAVITPVAMATYWLVKHRTGAGSMRPLLITAGSLVLIAAAGMAYVSYAARDVVVDPAAYAFPRSDLFRYGAKWWSYLVPPVGHPLVGETAHRVWNAAGVREGLIEQQLSLGWGIVALGLIASFRWLVRGDIARKAGRPACLEPVPILAIVAAFALLCSLSPERTIGTITFVRPSAFLYDVLPMFRSYARFGVVVQLMAALLAGLGVDYLRRAGTRRAQIACLALLVLAAGEYAVSPWALWRDVLPTAAHRWVARQPGRISALDCTPLNRESGSIPWLTGYRVTLLGNVTSDCMEPNLSEKLAAMSLTHLLVRRETSAAQWFATHPVDGVDLAATFDDGEVFAVTARAPAIYTASMTGFSPREHDAEWTWRWMGKGADWTIANPQAHPAVATLALELSALHRARRMEVRLDGRPVQTLVVEPSRRTYEIGPLTVNPGDHILAFHPTEAPTVADDVMGNGDRRPLSFALGTWKWSVRGDRQ